MLSFKYYNILQDIVSNAKDMVDHSAILRSLLKIN